MKRSRIIAIVLAAIVMLAGAVTAGATLATRAGSHPHNPEATHYQRNVHRDCVIRFDERDSSGATVPRLHYNGSHYCVGINGVSVNGNGWLQISSSNNEPIGSVIVSEDETLVSRGIRCGASGGGTITVIECYDNQNRPVKARYSHMYGPGSNLWISWTSYAGPGVQ